MVVVVTTEIHNGTVVEWLTSYLVLSSVLLVLSVSSAKSAMLQAGQTSLVGC